jgi:hypothetical protein
MCDVSVCYAFSAVALFSSMLTCSRSCRLATVPLLKHCSNWLSGWGPSITNLCPSAVNDLKDTVVIAYRNSSLICSVGVHFKDNIGTVLQLVAALGAAQKLHSSLVICGKLHSIGLPSNGVKCYSSMHSDNLIISTIFYLFNIAFYNLLRVLYTNYK